MHIDRGIVRTYRWSDGLYTRPDDKNTLTSQYDTKNALRDPLHVHITGEAEGRMVGFKAKKFK